MNFTIFFCIIFSIQLKIYKHKKYRIHIPDANKKNLGQKTFIHTGTIQ